MNNIRRVNLFAGPGCGKSSTSWSLAYELKKYREIAINLSASLIFGLAAAWCGLQLAS